MTARLAKHAYERLIEEDIAWLHWQPTSLARDHIEAVLRYSIVMHYPAPSDPEKPEPPPKERCERTYATHGVSGPARLEPTPPPHMTDLMVTPESLDAYLDDFPPAQSSDREKSKPGWHCKHDGRLNPAGQDYCSKCMQAPTPAASHDSSWSPTLGCIESPPAASTPVLPLGHPFHGECEYREPCMFGPEQCHHLDIDGIRCAWPEAAHSPDPGRGGRE